MDSTFHTKDQMEVVRGSFSYIDPDVYGEEKPYYYSGPLATSEEHLRTNLVYKTYAHIPIHDIRGREHQLSLDKHGIEFVRTPMTLNDEAVDGSNLEPYLQAATSFLRLHLNAQLVLSYDYRFRQSDPSRSAELSSGVPGSQIRPDEPANAPHIDHTLEGGLRRARRHMTTGEASRYLDGSWRVRILNLWRPLYHFVEDAPLAFCDAGTLRKEHLVAADRVSPQYAGEVYYVVYSPEQQWYFLSNQKPEEMALFVSYDSDPGSGPAYCPHAAFNCEGSSGSRGRKSLEVRAIVVSRRENA